MSRALYTAATGMLAQERKIDVIAHNLANVNTDGFKNSRPEFEDLMYQTLRPAGAGGSTIRTTSTGTQVGLGVKDGAIVRDFGQGNLKRTNRTTDLAISGRGFFVIEVDDGSLRLTRSGGFEISQDGELVTKSGHRVYPRIQIPDEHDQLLVNQDGSITVQMGDGSLRTVGPIQIAYVTNENLLQGEGGNLFQVADFDTNVRIGNPGEGSLGRIESSYLESSNVEVVEEMIAMITGQRAYEANSKVIQTADRMMEEANRLR